jgi:hypothetical protein
MILEVRICKKMAEIHVIDDANSHPISIIKSDLKTLNQLILKTMRDYSITKVKRNKKRLLTV